MLKQTAQNNGSFANAGEKEDGTAENTVLSGVDQATRAAAALSFFPTLRLQLDNLREREEQMKDRISERNKEKYEDLHGKIAALEEKLDEQVSNFGI